MIDNKKDKEAGPSKSQLKRVAHEQQALGKRLTGLANRQLRTLDLPDTLLEAIEAFHHLPKSHNARRRQLQFIGRLMRDTDQPFLKQQLQKLEAPSCFKPGLTLAEVWTERVLKKGSTNIECLLQADPSLNRQKLRQLQRKAIKAKDNAEQERIRQQLLTYLSDHL